MLDREPLYDGSLLVLVIAVVAAVVVVIFVVKRLADAFIVEPSLGFPFSNHNL